jgi:hypothetical protein
VGGVSEFVSEVGRMLGWCSETGVLMLWGFFDECGVLTKLTLGGCWARFEKWEALSIEWSHALERHNINVFHMTDFEANRGVFRGWENRRDQHKSLLNSLLDTMVEHIEIYSGFTKVVRRQDHPIIIYEQHLVDLLVRAGIDDDHSIVIARHPEYSATRMGQLVEAVETVLGKGAAKVKTWTVGEPKDFCPLQAADLVAYEIRCWARDKELHRAMRYPLRRLQERATSNWVSGIV